MRKSPLLLSILSALSGCGETFEGKGCMEVSAEVTACPGKNDVDVDDLSLPGQCGSDLEITEVIGSGSLETLPSEFDGGATPSCCYPVEVEDHDPTGGCIVGRPYYEDGKALCAPLVVEHAASPASPRVSAWSKAGAAEHASIAAFARLTLELLRHGAPSSLLRDVQQAALDEIRHAEVCWALAERFGGGRVRAGAFPFTGAVSDVSLADLAAAALREGCLSETLGAHVTEVAAKLAPEPAVRSALESIAAEEAIHAVLSYRIVAWALRTGGPEVRSAVRAALAQPWPRLDVEELAVRSGVDVALLTRAAERGVSDVLEPAVALLAA